MCFQTVHKIHKMWYSIEETLEEGCYGRELKIALQLV